MKTRSDKKIDKFYIQLLYLYSRELGARRSYNFLLTNAVHNTNNKKN